MEKQAEKITDKSPEKTTKSPQEATTVGMYLKYTRLSQKKTLDAVSKTLCIRKIYLKAIEESDFKELPPVPYGTGFIRSYAEYLGLNSDRIVQCYKEESMPQKEEHTVSIVKKHSGLTIPNKKQILIGIGAVLVIYLTWLLLNFKFETIKKPIITEKETAVELVTPEVSNPEQDLPPEPIVIDETGNFEADSDNSQVKMLEESYHEEPVKENTDTTTTDEDKSRIVLKLNGESWVEVKSKDKIYISGVYQKGFEYNIPNEKGLTLSLGRYYNVDVLIDDKLTEVASQNNQTNISLDKFLGH